MKAYSVGKNREDNGKYTAAYYFRYNELTQIDYALDELIAYWHMWSEDDRKDVREDALNQIDIITALGQKIDCYRSFALNIKEEEEE